MQGDGARQGTEQDEEPEFQALLLTHLPDLLHLLLLVLQQPLQTNALPFQLCQPPLQLIAALLQLPLRPLQLLELYLVLVSDPLNPNGRKGQAACLSPVLQEPSPATFVLQDGPRHGSKGEWICPTGDPGLFPQVRGKLRPCEPFLPALTLLTPASCSVRSSLERCAGFGGQGKGTSP